MIYCSIILEISERGWLAAVHLLIALRNIPKCPLGKKNEYVEDIIDIRRSQTAHETYLADLVAPDCLKVV